MKNNVTNTVKIRLATKKDIRAIAELSLEFDKMNIDNLANYEKYNLDDMIDQTKRDFAQKSRFHHIAEVDGKIAGYMLAFKIDELECYYVDELFVLPQYRKMKIALQFMNIVEKAAKEADYYVKTEVYGWNEGAINFYKKAGFTTEGFALEKNC